MKPNKIIVDNPLRGLYTLFLFTTNNKLLVTMPSIIAALAAAGPTDPVTFLQGFIWMQLHLWAFEIRNQTLGVDEDRICKPHRPFASNRIPMEHALPIYLVVVAMTLCYSFYHGLHLVSVAYLLGTTGYNELEWAKNPVLKNILGGWGYVCFTWGPIYIIGHHQPLSTTSIHTILTSFLTFSLTGHAQDFRDRSGDALMGRKTIPLIYSQRVARGSLIIPMLALTYGLSKLWSPPPLVIGIFVLLFLVTSITLIIQQKEEDDRKNFVWYEMWLVCAHLLPVFERRQVWNI